MSQPKLDMHLPHEVNLGIRKQRALRTVIYRNCKILQKIGVAFLCGTIVLALIIWVLDWNDAYSLTKNDTLVKSISIPAIVWYTKNIWWVPFNRKIKCLSGSTSVECEVFRRQTQPDDPEAYLFFGAEMDEFPLPRHSKTLWGLLNNDSPKCRLMFSYEKALNLFNYSSTFSRNSDLPFPLMALRGLNSITTTHYYVETLMKNSLLSEVAPVMYMQSNCFSASDRDLYVQKLMEYIKVDSFGTCLHNKDLSLYSAYTSKRSYASHLFGEELLQFIARYKFVVTIENGVCNDYVTEKIWRALEVGSVPIYYGSPLIRDWLPNYKSAILLDDFPTPELLSQHLHYLIKNDTAYEEYLEHKTLGLISNQKLMDEIKSRPYQNNFEAVVKKFECFVCEKLHDDYNAIKVMSKKHYDCMPPTSALTLSLNPDNELWLKYKKDVPTKIDQIYEEIWNQNQTPRESNTSWSWW